MIARRIIDGKPVWLVVVEYFTVQNIKTGELRLATTERRLFPGTEG